MTAGCGPLDSDGIVDVLDNKIVQGCYTSKGLPPLEIATNDIRTNQEVVYSEYQLVTHGRDAREIIIAKPRVLLVKSHANFEAHAYKFGEIVDSGSSTALTVKRGADGVRLIIVSNPDYKLHEYVTAPCHVQSEL